MMLVSIGNPRAIRRRWLSQLAFLVMTVSPCSHAVLAAVARPVRRELQYEVVSARRY